MGQGETSETPGSYSSVKTVPEGQLGSYCTCSIYLRTKPNRPEGGSSPEKVELGRRDPVLNSPINKSQKNIEDDKEIPEKILVRNVSLKREILMDVTIQTAENTIKTRALLDSGANDTFVDMKWAKENGLPLRRLPRPIPVFNVDGTKNQSGDITHATEFTMNYNGHTELVQVEVTNLGRTSVIIGFTWLVKHNPTID